MIKMVNEFKLTVVHFARPNPMQICACAWIYRWTKKLWKIRAGPPGHRAAGASGPPGLRAAGRWAFGPPGRWVAGLLSAKPDNDNVCCFLITIFRPYQPSINLKKAGMASRNIVMRKQ